VLYPRTQPWLFWIIFMIKSFYETWLFLCPFHSPCVIYGARGTVADWGTMVQAGRWRLIFSMRSVNFVSNLPNLSDSTIALGFTKPLAEMSTKSRKIIFLRSKVGPVCMADNLTAICEPTF
jgi:hypothetical protein